MSEMDLLTKNVTVRGKTYVVSEMDGATAAALRKATGDGDHGTDMLLVQRCCVDPKLNADQVAKLPNVVVKALARAAMDLGEDAPAAKNG